MEFIKKFLDSHRLVLKKPSLLEQSRDSALRDPFLIYEFFDLLEKAVDSLGLRDKPAHIYNLDETSVFTDPTRHKVVAERGVNISRTTPGSGKACYTILVTVNANGDKLPPLIVFKAKHFYDNRKGSNPYPGTIYGRSDNDR